MSRKQAVEGVDVTVAAPAFDDTVIAVFAAGIIVMLSITTTSFREWFGIPEFDLGFSTSMPNLIVPYVAAFALRVPNLNS